MNLFKKLKNLATKTSKSDNDTTQTADTKNHHAQDDSHPISRRIGEWVDSHNWKYDHRTPDDDSQLRTHRFLLRFNDNIDDVKLQWNCIIRIHEKTQLITLYGLPQITIPRSHYLLVMSIISAVNYALGFGSIDFNITTGDLHAKVSFDAEFTDLSDKALASYLQACASITAKTYDLINSSINSPDDIHNALLSELSATQDETYYLMTDTRQ